MRSAIDDCSEERGLVELLDPLAWVAGSATDKAVDRLVEYMSRYAGRYFEPLAAQGDAYRFEATDIVAVSCLGVTVPAELAGWLLVGEGAEEAGLLLEGIPADAALQDHDLDGNPSAQALWCLLEGWTGMGPTKVSKLMAAKRPALVPIYDDFLGAALVPQAGHWWRPWQDLLQGPGAAELVAATEFVRAQASRKVDVSRLSTLRILDIVIWKSEEEERRSERNTR